MPDSLRICFVSADYPTTSTGGIGGIGAHTYALAHAIADLGHEVCVLAQSETSASRHADGPVTVHAIARGSMRLWKLGRWLPVMWLRRSLAVWHALRRLHAERPFDIVSFPDGYGEGFRFSYSPLAPYAVQLFGPASVVQRWDGRSVPRFRARAESWMERRPTARAAITISATRRFADLLAREWSLDASRIRIIRNPIDLARFRPAHGHGIKHKMRVLFVGHLQRLKGMHALAGAIPIVLERHPGAEFLLVGNDTNSAPDGTSMLRFMQRKLEAAGALSRVRFAEPMPQSALVPVYQSCSVFVLPSLNDVYPNAVLEAMACGRPCVVTSTVGVAELVTESRCGLVVPPDDTNALAAAIGELLALPAEMLDEMGARGREIVERACAAPVIAAQAVDAYREAIGRRGADSRRNDNGRR
jgi:glycogen(starch) synthase